MSAAPDRSRTRREQADVHASPAVELEYGAPSVASATLAKDVLGRNFDALATVGCIYLALITVGFAAFRFLPYVQPTGASRNPDRTFFAAINAVTMTGFTANSASAANYPLLGRALVAALAVAGSLVVMLGCGWFLRSTLRLRGTVGFVTMFGLSVALIAWPLLFTAGVGWFDAISAGTGLGWATTPSLIVSQPSVWRWLMLAGSVPATLGPLLVLGLFTPRLSDRAPIVRQLLIADAMIYLMLLLAFLVTGASVSVASFEALNTRGLGVAGDAPGTLPGATVWTMLLAMCVGAGPAAIAGGLSLLPLVLVGRGAIAALRGRRVESIAGVAIVWIAAFITLLAMLVVLFARTNQPMPGDRQLFLVVSAFCNVGLSHDPIGVTGSGLVLLSAAMLLGRLLPLVMLCWMAIATEREPATVPT